MERTNVRRRKRVPLLIAVCRSICRDPTDTMLSITTTDPYLKPTEVTIIIYGHRKITTDLFGILSFFIGGASSQENILQTCCRDLGYSEKRTRFVLMNWMGKGPFAHHVPITVYNHAISLLKNKIGASNVIIPSKKRETRTS